MAFSIHFDLDQFGPRRYDDVISDLLQNFGTHMSVRRMERDG